jgi:hypothetical protein
MQRRGESLGLARASRARFSISKRLLMQFFALATGVIARRAQFPSHQDAFGALEWPVTCQNSGTWNQQIIRVRLS